MNNEPKKTNALCIAGLVCSFLIAPLGLILSIVGVVQVKKNNEDGKALGIAGIIIGALGTLFQIIALVFTIFAFVSFANDTKPMFEEVEGIIDDSKTGISRARAEIKLEDACGKLDSNGDYAYLTDDEYTIKCEDYFCTLKTEDDRYTKKCSGGE